MQRVTIAVQWCALRGYTDTPATFSAAEAPPSCASFAYGTNHLPRVCSETPFRLQHGSCISCLPPTFPSSWHPQARYLADCTKRTEEQISQDFIRPRYFNPYEAVSYGLIDTVSEVEVMLGHVGVYICITGVAC